MVKNLSKSYMNQRNNEKRREKNDKSESPINYKIYFFNRFNDEKKKSDKKPNSNDEKGNHFWNIRKSDKSKRYNKKIIMFNKRKNLLYNLLLLLLSILNIYISLSQETDDSIYSYVILKVVKGQNKVYSDLGGKKDKGCSPAFTKPDEIYINKDSVENKPLHNFTKKENIVKLIWKKNITNCRCMFRDCGHVI